MTCYSKPVAFPLLKLPFLPIKLIIELMTIGEIMLMSICSQRLFHLVKIGKYRLNAVHAHLKSGNLNIEIKRTPEDFCNCHFNLTESGETVPKGCGRLSQWFQNGNSATLNFITTTSIDNVLCVFKHSGFCVKDFCWNIYPEELKNRNLKNLTSKLDIGTGREVSVIGGSLDNNALSFLIDRMNSEASLTVTSEIKLNFKHPKALHFREVKYEDARWMTVDDLKSIRNDSCVYLNGRTNIDNNDLNELIHFWRDQKKRMFLKLEIRLREGVKLDGNTIMNGVIGYHSISDDRYYFLAKKSIQTHSVGSIEFSNGLIILTAWMFDSQREYTVPVLTLLEQKHNLKVSYSEIIKKERELNERLALVEDEEEKNELKQEKIQLEAEKRTIHTLFDETVDELRTLRVTGFDAFLDLNA